MIGRPILYTFRRCPYAIRSRLSLAASKLEYESREVSLKNKPKSLLAYSAKGTVPVLVLEGGEVIEQSLDIMYWALKQSDPCRLLLLTEEERACATALIEKNDYVFKPQLDRYKYSDRHPQETQLEYRIEAEKYIEEIECILSKHDFLMGSALTMVDLAVMPFIRQFAFVDDKWFFDSEYRNTVLWLENMLVSDLFSAVMAKHEFWLD